MSEVLEWFKTKGINEGTLEHFGIRGIPGSGGIAFPYGDVDKVRYGIPTGPRSFKWSRSTAPLLFNRSDASRQTVYLCEGETDTMRLWQELQDRDGVPGVVGLPGISTWNESMARDLADAECVYVVLDNETDYNVSRQVDDAFRSIRRDLGTKAKRIILPKGYNDVCDFFADHSLDSFCLLVARQPQAGESRFRTLDLTKEPPKPEWVIDNFICKGDIHLMIGEPDIGKSWITMAMAVAVAKGEDTFLGHPIPGPGRVLYFDEENPEDLIFHRFIRLGLDKASAKNIRFIHNDGLRLDRSPEIALDEALDYNPSLIVLDSLTRFHGQEENSAGAMADLFNSAIKPLARESQAGLVIIHHVNKTDSSSSFIRARGSGDITAAVDSGFDITKVSGGLIMKSFKNRRAAQANTQYLSIVDTEDGGVELLSISGISNNVF